MPSEGIEPITESAVDSLDVNGAGFGNDFAQHGADLNGEQLAMLIAMLDGLRQAHLRWYYQRRTAPLPRTDRLTIRPLEDRCIAPPSIATPGQRPALRAFDGESHCLFDEIVTDASRGTGGDEAAGAVLHEASPSLAGIGLLRLPVFFRTNDQNSSISTVERCRSCVRMVVKASACKRARRSHSPIVSYLWPVISSAARKLPRRMTMSSA